MISDWHPTTWSYEHPEHGFFFVCVHSHGVLATHVTGHEVLSLPAKDGTPDHRNIAAAMLACERRLEQLDAERALDDDDAPCLRLVAR